MTKTVYKQQFDVAFHRVRCITSSFHEEIYTECSWLARHIFLVNRAKMAKNKVRNAECNTVLASLISSSRIPFWTRILPARELCIFIPKSSKATIYIIYMSFILIFRTRNEEQIFSHLQRCLKLFSSFCGVLALGKRINLSHVESYLPSSEFQTELGERFQAELGQNKRFHLVELVTQGLQKTKICHRSLLKLHSRLWLPKRAETLCNPSRIVSPSPLRNPTKRPKPLSCQPLMLTKGSEYCFSNILIQ